MMSIRVRLKELIGSNFGGVCIKGGNAASVGCRCYSSDVIGGHSHVIMGS